MYPCSLGNWYNTLVTDISQPQALDKTLPAGLEEQELAPGRVPVCKGEDYYQMPPLMTAPQEVERS